VWSPDGSSIAFSSNRLGNHLDYDIHTVGPDGSHITPLTQLRQPGSFYGPNAFSPDWSPDGEKLVFSSDLDYWTESGAYGERDIYVMNSDGSNVVNLTRTPERRDEYPVWSPDGTRIAFSWNNTVWVMNADGTQRSAILTGNWISDVNWQSVNQPPDCSAVTAEPARLSPPNHRFRTVTLAGAADADGDPIRIDVTGVTQDERVRAAGDSTAPDAIDTRTPNEVRLRAERNRRGDGRVYWVAFEATDSFGASCSGRAMVDVPRRRGVPAVDSAPPSYDSFGV
jgi:dipeptidyl aminopeptidase/acylaminoacyl peptidase